MGIIILLMRLFKIYLGFLAIVYPVLSIAAAVDYDMLLDDDSLSKRDNNTFHDLPGPGDNKTLANPTAIHRGIGTYYYQGGVAGSCGVVHTDSDRVAALSKNWRKGNAHCGQKIWAKALNGPGAGHETFAYVFDTCEGCSDSHVDFSEHAFKDLTYNTIGAGVIEIEWHL